MTVTPSLMKRWELLSLNLKMAQVARPTPSTTATTVT